MSGIYIPGLAMPTTGLYLVSVDNSCGEDETVMTVMRMLGNRDVCKIIGVYNLVPVPEHGDLIDLDSTIEKIRHLSDEIDKKLGYEKSAPYITMALYLSNADDFPIIIPAEEREE